MASYIEIPKDINNGDYAFPCFRLAKTLRKAPPVIANEIKENLKFHETIITKVEIAGGYLNFFVNKEAKIKTVLEEISQNKEYGKSEIGKGKNIIVEYSSPNILLPSSFISTTTRFPYLKCPFSTVYSYPVNGDSCAV